MSNSLRDLIVDKPSGGGLRSLVVEKKNPSGNGSEPGISSGSPSKSSSPLPSDEDRFKDEIIPRIADIAKRQDTKVNGLFSAPTIEDPLTENIRNARANRIMSGDTDEMVRTLKKERELLKARKEAPAPHVAPVSTVTPLMALPAAQTFHDGSESFDPEAELDDVRDAVAKKIKKESADKLLELRGNQLLDAAPEIGEKMRSKLSDIGADNVFHDEKGRADYALRNDYALGGLIRVPKGRDSEEFKYNSAAKVLDEAIKNQVSQLDKMEKDFKVNKFIHGTPEERVLLDDDPTVVDFKSKVDRLEFLVENTKELSRKFPSVKYQQDKQLIADAYAERLNHRNQGTNVVGLGGVRQLKQIFLGDHPGDDDVAAIAKQLGMNEDAVRSHIEMDKVKLPSYLGRAWLSATGVAQSAGQGIVRTAMDDKAEASIINRQIEETKYQTPDRYSEKYSSDWIFDKMSNGLGQFVGFVATGSVAAAPLKGAAGLLGRAAVAGSEAAAAGAGRVVAGVSEEAAASEIVAGAQRAAANVAAGASSAAARTTLSAVNNRIGEYLMKAANSGSTLGTGYYSSYNDAYNYAATQTDNEADRHRYAQGVGFANGVSELILNDIDLAEKMLKGVSPATILERMAAKKTAFTTGDVFLARIGEFAKVMGYESAEELVPYFTELVLKNNMFGVKTSTAEVLKGAFDTVVETAISTVPMAGLSLRSSVPTSQLTRTAIYEGSKNADHYRELFKNRFETGKSDEKEMNQRIQLVNTLDNIRQSIPAEVDGAQISEEKKIDLTSLMLQQRQLAAEMETKSKVFHPIYTQKIAAIEDQINTILNRPEQEDAPGGLQSDEQQPGLKQQAAEQQPEDQFDDEDLFVQPQEQQSPVPLLVSGNSLASEIIDAHKITDLDEIDDSEMFTTFLSPDQTGIAEAIDNRIVVSPAGKRLKVQVPGVVLKSLINTNQDATTQTQTQDQEDSQQSDVEQRSPADSQQQSVAQEKTAIESADFGDISGDSKQKGSQKQVVPTLQQRLDAARQASEAERPSMEDNLSFARRDAARQQAREDDRARRNEFAEVQSPVVSVGQNGNYSTVNTTDDGQNAENNIQENEATQSTPEDQPGAEDNQQPATQPAGIEGVKGSYQFGPKVHIAASELSQSQSYRKGKPFIGSAEFAGQQPVTEPILVHKDSRGKIVVLDGRARLAGAKRQSQTNVPVRFFKGTDEQAKEVAQLLRSDPHRSPATLVNRRADMVLSRPPESFREAMLQMVLGHLSQPLKSRRPLFSIEGFKRFVRSVMNRNPYRANDGKVSPEWATLIAQKIIGKDAKRKIDTFVSETWVAQTGRDESDLMEELADIILSFPTREGLINEIATLQQDAEAPLKEILFPLSVTEDEAFFIAENSLADVVNEIAFGEDVPLNADEVQRLESIVHSNANPDGSSMDMDGIYREVFESADPITQSLANKLIEYAKTKQTEITESIGRDELGAEQEVGGDWLETPFSRSQQSTTRKITAHQGKIIASAIGKVFKTRRVVVDKDAFFDKLKDALRRSQVSPQVQSLMEELDGAKETLGAAQRSFNAKRKELDAAIQADTEDLFGQRQQQAGGLFDERVDASARETALKPFAEKLQKAKNNVAAVQKRLDAALLNGNIQGALFSKDGTVMGFVLDGTVYLNPSEVRVDTPFHEIGGHLLTDWARRNNPELLAKIYEVAGQAPESVTAHVRKNYPNLEEGSPEFSEEVFATAIGWDQRNIDRAEQLLDSGWKNKIVQIWRNFINMLAEAGIIRFSEPFNNSEIEDMTLSDFSNLVGEVMFAGRRLSDKSDLPNVRAMGADFSFLAADDFVYDNYGNIVDVRQEVKQQIVEEKQTIKANAIAEGRFMMAPDGTRTSLTEDQWLSTRTQRFRDWDINKPELRSKIIDSVSGLGGKNIDDLLNETVEDDAELVISFGFDQTNRDRKAAGKPPYTKQEYMDKFEKMHRDLIEGYEASRLRVNKSIEDIKRKLAKGPDDELLEDLSKYIQDIAGYENEIKYSKNILAQIASATPKKNMGVYGDILVAMSRNTTQHPELIKYLTDQALDAPDALAKIVGRSVVDMVLEYEYSKGSVLTDSRGEPLVSVTEEGAPVFERADGAMKSAGNIGTFSNETNDVRFQRIGEGSRLTPLQKTNHNLAVQMEQQGHSPEGIFLSTGWFRDNADSKWRYELPNDNVRFLPDVKGTDANITLQAGAREEFVQGLARSLNVHPENAIKAATEIWLYQKTDGGKKIPKEVTRLEGTQFRAEFNMFGPKEYAELYKKYKKQIDKAVGVNYNYTTTFRLEDVLDYPELYAAHPDMKDLPVHFVSGGSRSGAYSRTADGEKIEVRRDDAPAEQYVALRHEVQHGLQERLGFEKGADFGVAKKYYDLKVLALGKSIKKLDKLPARTAVQQRELDLMVEEKRGLIDNKNDWIYHFYRSFAGEREAYGVEARAAIKDAMRVSMIPQMGSPALAIRHSETGIINQLKHSFGSFFKRSGAYRGDPTLQALDAISNELKGAKAVAAKLRRLAKAVEGDTGNLSATLLALPKAVVSSALRAAALVIEGGGSMAKALNAAYRYIEANVHGNTRLDRREIKSELAGLFQREGLEANAIFKRSLNITSQIIDAVKSDPEFMTTQKFLDLFETEGVRYHNFADLPDDVKNRMRSIFMMNDDQLDIFKNLVEKVKASKVKNLEAKFNRELEAVKDDLSAASRAKRNRRRVRLNDQGEWEPIALPKNMEAMMKDYLQTMDEWQPVKDGEDLQQARFRHRKQDIFLPDDVYAYAKTNIELSDVSMRAMIQKGYDTFGPTPYLAVLHAIGMDAKFNPAAKSSLFKNFMDMDLGYTYKVRMEIARMDKAEARQVSDVMAMRRLMGGIPANVEEAIDQAFGEKSAGIRQVKTAVDAALASSDVTVVQEAYEAGMTEATAEADIAQLKEDAKVIAKLRKDSKKRDAEIKRTAREAANNAKLSLQQSTGENNMAGVVKNIKERINKLKC